MLQKRQVLGSSSLSSVVSDTTGDQTRRHLSPHMIMLCVLAISIAATALTIALASSRPWLGLELSNSAENTVIIAHVVSDGPARDTDAAAGFRLTAISQTGDASNFSTFPIYGSDLVEEPDGLETYAAIADVLDRQTILADLLAQPVVRLHLVETANEEARVVDVAPRDRPFWALPAVFWVQLFSGLAGFAIGAWVWAIRGKDIAACMFALSGLGLMISALSAAVYSTRELAIPGDIFALLSALNHLGVHLFGGAIVALFLSYPRRLVRPVWLLLIPVVLVPWLWADIARLMPDPATGMYVPMLAEMLLIVALVMIQWRLARRDPATRAALRWLGLSVVVGAGAFVVGIGVPSLLGAEPAISQGYAFAFFLIVYGGIALGIHRYKLFELGDWAFRILFYAGGAALLLGLDAALIWLLNIERGPALGASLLLVGFAYLPLRDVLWRRMRGKPVLAEHELFEAAMDVAFGPTPTARAERWRRLLAQLYDPLETLPATDVNEVIATTNGLELLLPAVAGETALRLRYPLGGKGLFGPRDKRLAGQLIGLIARAEASRDAYERGAIEERQRIARDLHDDVGARLLTGLHSGDGQVRPILQAALSDIRAIVSGLNGETATLDVVLAEARHEAARRLEAARIELDWPAPEQGAEQISLDYRQSKALLSSVREIVSNIVRHAGATRVKAEIVVTDISALVRISDNGRGLPAQQDVSGYGLNNIRQRVHAIGGTTLVDSSAAGTAIEIVVPLANDPTNIAATLQERPIRTSDDRETAPAAMTDAAR